MKHHPIYGPTLSVVVFIASIVFSTSLFAQQQEEEIFELDEIIVSGGLTPIESEAYGRSVTILTAEEIESRGVKYAVDALRAMPGIAVSRTGSQGGNTQVRIRGAEGNHTLVLIDGVKVESTLDGEYNFAGLMADNIEKIEVLRGPQSSLYGSSAIGGVIFITTKKSENSGLVGEARTQVGSDDTFANSITAHYGSEDSRVSLSIMNRDTGGYDISEDAGGDIDGDENMTINLTASHDINQDITFGGTWRQVDRSVEVDDTSWLSTDRDSYVVDDDGYVEVEEGFASFTLDMNSFGGRLENKVSLSFAEIESQSFLTSFPSDDRGTRNEVRYQGTYALDASTLAEANQSITLGLESQEQTFESGTIDHKASASAVIAEYRGALGDSLDLQASVRHDKNDDFDDFTSYALGLSKAFAQGASRLHASFGTAVKNPTMIERFGGSYTAENPDLSPENSQGWDVGIEQELAEGSVLVDVTYFEDKLEDIIGSSQNSGGDWISANKEGTSERRGIEISATASPFERMDVDVHYTWLEAKDPNGDVEVRRPKNALSVHANYLLSDEKTRLSAGVRQVSGLYDRDWTLTGGGRLIKLDDYSVVDLAVRHDLFDWGYISLDVNNAFDAYYDEVFGYPAPGRTSYLSIGVKF